MIEKFLIDSRAKCGTKKNFSSQISDDLRTNSFQHWYFLTPLKVSDKGGNLKEVTINFAYPFLATKDDIEEIDVLKRLDSVKTECESALVKFLKKWFSVQSFTFSLIPFYGNETAERTERKDFGNNKIHLLNGVVTFRYRENYFNCNC